MNKQKFDAKHSQDKNIIIGVFIALLVLGGLMVWLSQFSPKAGGPGTGGATATTTFNFSTSTASTTPGAKALPAGKEADLAKYLTAQGIKMYGAEWCTHCQDQKKAFGDAFKFITYVECPQNTKLCLARGIEGYPTWEKPSGEKIDGFQSLPDLAAWAGFKY